MVLTITPNGTRNKLEPSTCRPRMERTRSSNELSHAIVLTKITFAILHLQRVGLTVTLRS